MNLKKLCPMKQTRPNKDKELNELKEIFRTANISPVFRPNPSFAIEIGDGNVPYISLGDVLENLYLIRLLPEGQMTQFPITENGSILVEYPSLERLVHDGWTLD